MRGIKNMKNRKTGILAVAMLVFLPLLLTACRDGKNGKDNPSEQKNVVSISISPKTACA
jgi:hypothetical protein